MEKAKVVGLIFLKILAVLGAISSAALIILPFCGYLGDFEVVLWGALLLFVSIVLGAWLELWPLPEVPNDYQ